MFQKKDNVRKKENMLSNENYLTTTLTNGLVNLLTLRGFCLNINFSFLENNESYKNTAHSFYDKFTNLTNELLNYADGILSEAFLNSGALVTKYTLPTVELTEKLFSVSILMDTIEKMSNLKPAINVSNEVVEELDMINKVSLVIALNFKDFLTDIFNKETNNQLYSYSYPFLIRKMIEEVELYSLVLERLIRKSTIDPTFVSDFEYRFINLLKGFGMFLRSFIDPSRNDLIIKAQSYIIEIDNLLNEYKKLELSPDNQRLLSLKARRLEERFGEFLSSIIEQLLAGEVYLIIEPIFLDNMYRSINLSTFYIFDPDKVYYFDSNIA